MEKVISPCSSSAGDPQSATERGKSETPQLPFAVLGPSGGSVSYRCAGFVLHTTSVTNVIVYETGAPGVVEGATCVVTSGPDLGSLPSTVWSTHLAWCQCQGKGRSAEI